MRSRVSADDQTRVQSDPEFWMSRDSVIIDRDPAIGCDELAAFRQQQGLISNDTRPHTPRRANQFELIRLIASRAPARDRRVNGFTHG